VCNHYRNDLRKIAHLLPGYEEFSESRIPLRFPQLKLNLFPDGEGLVVRLDDNGRMVPDVMRWGFPPVQGNVVTNVRRPTQPFWRPWTKAEWRCLVPATSFAEWSPGPPKGERWFALPGGEPFMLAGLWRPWTGARGPKKAPVEGEHKLYAFLTTDANAVVKPIHPKAMPVILPRDAWDTWLTGSPEEALALQRPWPDDALELAAGDPAATA